MSKSSRAAGDRETPMEEVSPHEAAQDAQDQNMDLMELQNGTRPRGAVSSTRKKPSTKMKRGSEQGSRKGEY